MSKKNEARTISNFAEIEVRLARKSIAEFAASPKMTLKDALLCIGAVKSHLDRAGVFHEMFNPFIGAYMKSKNHPGKNAKMLIEQTHRKLAALKEGK